MNSQRNCIKCDLEEEMAKDLYPKWKKLTEEILAGKYVGTRKAEIEMILARLEWLSDKYKEIEKNGL